MSEQSHQAPLVVLDDVTVDRDGNTVLHGVNLSWSEPRLGVIGANGSGKSTFARLLNGLIRPTTGRVQVDGLCTTRDANALRKRVGFVFQQPDHQIVMPLVHEDVAFGLVNRGLPAHQVAQRVRDVLAQFGLDALAERASHSLSGGEKQLLALAGAVAGVPKMVVFDEPTAMLDLSNRKRFQRAVADLEQHVVLVTHDLELLADFDRVLYLHDGRVVGDGAPREVIAAYRNRVNDEHRTPADSD